MIKGAFARAFVMVLLVEKLLLVVFTRLADFAYPIKFICSFIRQMLVFNITSVVAVTNVQSGVKG